MRLRRLALGAAALGLAIQLVPVDRSRRPVVSEIPAPPEVRAILERCCYDCHSHETVWPWYGYVAPVSWLLAYDVREARKHMNLSVWDGYSPKKQAKHREEIPEEVDEGNMPPWYYLLLHRDARPSDADREILRAWAESGAGSP
jgi:Haem-binding domain